MEEQNAVNTPAPMDRETIAREVLRSVIDPEIGINVVDLGMVYEVIVKNNRVYVEMTMTTQGCPMHESICDAARRSLQQAFPAEEITVHLVWEPAWTPERLSDSAKKQLGY